MQIHPNNVVETKWITVGRTQRESYTPQGLAKYKAKAKQSWAAGESKVLIFVVVYVILCEFGHM